MSLQLILGNSGSGKSYQLYKTIIQASTESPETMFLVIVPEQFTMQTQRELVGLHPSRGLLNIDILSFQRLAHRIFEEVGADRRTVLEETGKTLLLRRAAMKEQEHLRILKGNLKKQGYLQEVKSLISELTQYDIDEEKMERLLESAEGKPQLYYKLQDIQILYESFRRELAGKYITAEETLDALCQVAEQSKILKDCVIAMDGFTGFTPIQQKLMKKLLVLAKKVFITVTIDTGEEITRIRGEHELFYLSKKTIRSLTDMAREAGCEIEPPMVLAGDVSPRFTQSPRLRFLEAHLFRDKRSRAWRGSTEEREPAISLHTAANPMMEAHFAARTIRHLVQQGYRYQDIAVIVGDLSSYQNYIQRVFEICDIPCFLDNTRSLLDNPFVELLRSVLDLVQQDYRRSAVFRLLRTGLCPADSKETDLLENYVLAAGIRGFSVWKKEFSRRPESFEESQVLRCEEIRLRLMEMLEPFTLVMRSKRTTAREKTEALYELICRLEIQKKMAIYEKQFRQEKKPELQKEYAQIYGMVMGLFDKMVQLLGEEILSTEEYTEILEAGIREEKVGIIPPSADQIQVGDLERSRLKDIRALIFLGLNDGWVPASGNGGGLLSDMEREMLMASRVELAPTSRQDSYIQKFYLYLNLTKPSEKLYLSCSKGSMDGKVLRPSYILRQMGRMFPDLKTVDEDEKQSLEERAVTPENGLSFLAEGFGRLRTEPADGSWLELYNWYRRRDGYRECVEKLMEAAFAVFDDSGIGKEAAKRLYGEVLVNSVSRLETFATCAFAHFLQYGLRIREREEYEFQPADIGKIVHQVVELFSERVEKSEYDWFTLPEEVRNRMVEEAVEEVTEEYGQKILHSSARNESMIRRMKRILRRTAWALQEQIRSGHFQPVGFEVAFSRAENLDAVNIALSREEKMRLRGRIDRIDVCEKEDQVYVKVIDYKSGNTGFDLAALYYGLQLQLVVYLGAALEMEKRIHPDKEIIPAGIFYYRVKDPLVDAEPGDTPEKINDRLLRALRPDGLVNKDPDIYEEMDTDLYQASSVIPVSRNRDGSLSKTSKAVSSEQFEQLTSFVHKKIREIGRQILDGEIAPIPYERKQQTGCDYCTYRSVCGWDAKIPGTRRNRWKTERKEEIWKQISDQAEKKEEKDPWE